MPRFEVEKHPDYYRTEEDKTWFYVLIAILVIIVLFILWLLSRLF